MKTYVFSSFVVVAALFLSGCQSQEPTQVTQTDSEPKRSDDTFLRPQERSSSWEFDGEKWRSGSSVPACPEPLLMKPPVDMSLVSGILYPGQYRGNDYKPHGGFRFDGKKTGDVTVHAPLDAYLTIGSRYIEQGEIQYSLLFENACGIAYRFDHLLTLSPAMQKIADTLPQALPDDSRTTRFVTPVEVKVGDIIATAVGFAQTQNVSVDWGVYDLRQSNAASKNESFAKKHDNGKEQAWYALCWFDLLPQDIAQQVRSLPAASSEGKTSDYCL